MIIVWESMCIFNKVEDKSQNRKYNFEDMSNPTSTHVAEQ